jgi:hypothetical protein
MTQNEINIAWTNLNNVLQNAGIELETHYSIFEKEAKSITKGVTNAITVYPILENGKLKLIFAGRIWDGISDPKLPGGGGPGGSVVVKSPQ